MTSFDTVTAALTVQQPWVWAITDHGKRVENRVWAPGYRIDRLLIHAGLTLDKHAVKWFNDSGLNVPDGLVTGSIVAITSLVGVCSTTVRDPAVVCRCGLWAAAGQHHWQLGDVEVLPEPIPCRGRLGLWQPSDDIVAVIDKAVR